MTIGQRIKQIRKSKKLTQQQLGDLIGIDGSAVRKYEAGKMNARPDTLEKIAAALEVDVETLIYSELNYNRAMHQIFRIIDTYDGDICFCDQIVTDKNGKEITQKVATVNFGELTPFIEELKVKKELLSPEELIEYKNTFPKSTDVPSYYIDLLKKFDK